MRCGAVPPCTVSSCDKISDLAHSLGNVRRAHERDLLDGNVSIGVSVSTGERKSLRAIFSRSRGTGSSSLRCLAWRATKPDEVAPVPQASSQRRSQGGVPDKAKRNAGAWFELDGADLAKPSHPCCCVPGARRCPACAARCSSLEAFTRSAEQPTKPARSQNHLFTYIYSSPYPYKEPAKWLVKWVRTERTNLASLVLVKPTGCGCLCMSYSEACGCGREGSLVSCTSP